MNDTNATGVDSFGRALSALLEELDWPLLEREYCEGESAGFFRAEQVEAQRDAGLHFCTDLAERLGAGKSLYVGAGLAELPQILFEDLVLSRDLEVVTLPGREADEIQRALRKVGRALDLRLPRLRLRPLSELDQRNFDHLWLASVLTDPQAFPALHAALYKRGASPGKRLTAERRRAADLLGEAFVRMAPPAWVHTSDEESELVAQAAASRGFALDPANEARLSPIVGDPIRAYRMRRV